MSVDLSTEYLGIRLKNPLVVSACSLTLDTDVLKQLEKAGAAAAVLPSLFQEQVEHDEVAMSDVLDAGTESFAESLSYFPEPAEYRCGADNYLESVAAAKKAVDIPVIASLNGTSEGGWIRYAKMVQDAGADALELNLYQVAADTETTGQQIEQQCFDLVAAVKKSVSIPVAVKIGPYFSAMANMAKRLTESGADGLVLFNRFIQPDFNLAKMEMSPELSLSSPHEMLVPLRWVAILYGRISASLALTGGIHDAEGMVKSILAGADVGMLASALYRKGPEYVETVLKDTARWMEKRKFESIEQLQGNMSRQKCPDPAAFQRGNYMKALASYTGPAI